MVQWASQCLRLELKASSEYLLYTKGFAKRAGDPGKKHKFLRLRLRLWLMAISHFKFIRAYSGSFRHASSSQPLHSTFVNSAFINLPHYLFNFVMPLIPPLSWGLKFQSRAYAYDCNVFILHKGLVYGR